MFGNNQFSDVPFAHVYSDIDTGRKWNEICIPGVTWSEAAIPDDAWAANAKSVTDYTNSDKILPVGQDIDTVESIWTDVDKDDLDERGCN